MKTIDYLLYKIPADLHRKMKIAAVNQDITIRELIFNAIKLYLGE